MWALWRRGEPFAAAARSVAGIAAYPAVAIIGFTIFSRVVVGEWFVASDFFVAENKSLHDPVVAAEVLLELHPVAVLDSHPAILS